MKNFLGSVRVLSKTLEEPRKPAFLKTRASPFSFMLRHFLSPSQPPKLLQLLNNVLCSQCRMFPIPEQTNKNRQAFSDGTEGGPQPA